MNFNTLTFILVCFSFSLFENVFCTRYDVHLMMYRDLKSNAACFRRMNATHQSGCSSDKGGNTGIIKLINNVADLNNFVHNSTVDMYVLVLPINMFNNQVAEQLIKQNNIAGLLVIYNKTNIPDNYSPDDTCPNSLLTPCNGQNVNPYGNKFLFVDWPFPMFMIDNANAIKAITECYNIVNVPIDMSSSRPLCSVQMKSHMFAAVNTPTCLRRTSTADFTELRYCDAMGDQNIILPMQVFRENIAKRSVVVIAARLDAASMFDGIATGAVTSATSIVTLLSTASILRTLLKDYGDTVKHVMFVFLNGEVYDYIGSSRLIYDIQKGDFYSSTSFNFTLENIMLFLEISQIDSNPNIFLHKTSDEVVDAVSNQLIKTGSNYSLKIENSTGRLFPPSSLQMFIKSDPLIPAVLISNFDKEFTNKYYNGLDNADTIKYKYGDHTTGSLQKNIASLSSTIASTIFNLVTESLKVVSPEEHIGLVDELLHCYVQTKLCKLIKEVLNGNEENFDDDEPLSLYVGVDRSANPVTSITGLLLAYFTSDNFESSKDNCSSPSSDQPFSYIWIHGPNSTGLCLNTTLKFMQAKSPAFLIENYDWLSGNYSTWTESVWNEISLVLFLKPSKYQEYITFATGVVVFIISFAAVFWLTRKSNEVIFTPSSALITSC